MVNDENNINEFLRNKFLDHQVTPPPVVWNNIERKLFISSLFSTRNISLAIIALLLIALPITYYILDYSDTENQNKTEIVQQSEDKNKSTLLDKEQVDESVIANEETSDNRNSDSETTVVIVLNNNKADNIDKEDKTVNIIKLEEGFVAEEEHPDLINALASVSLTSENTDISDLPLENQDETVNTLTDIQKKTTFWEYSVLASPEFSLTNMDSVSIMNSISLGIEPMKYLNNHWFIRSGINVSYNGDKGFAKVDYMSNDMMGTYDDVVNVTFDSIGGEMLTVYHTKTVEVWDSVRHIVVSEITNRYLYANIPALIGYKSEIGKLNWYVYAGAAVGLQLTKWIDKPLANTEDINIIELDNKLPLRSNINYQLWLGCGLEYNLDKRYSLVLEPTYKYFFKSLYDNSDYNINTSAFALRFGVNIKFSK